MEQKEWLEMQSEWFDFMRMEQSTVYDTLLQKVNSGTLKGCDIHGYFRHLPTNNESEDESEKWPEDIIELADKSRRLLYNYCICNGIISEDIPYKEFLEVYK